MKLDTDTNVELFIDPRRDGADLPERLGSLTADCGCRLELHNVQTTEGRARARELGLERTPAVAVGGKTVVSGRPDGELTATLLDDSGPCLYDLFAVTDGGI